MTKLKILHCVEAYYPSVGGMQEVVKQLSERLVSLGHSVDVATGKHADRNFASKNGVTVLQFDVKGNWVNGMEGEVDRYRDFLLNSNYDVIVFFAVQQWATDIALPILDKIKAKKVSVPTGYSAFYWPSYSEYFEKMKSWIRHFDMNVYLSNDYRDINFARENNVSNVMVIPNGASEDEFLPSSEINVRKELGLKDDTYLILLVGSYSGWKGHHEALEIFLRSKLKNAALLMIGNNYTEFGIGKRSHTKLYLLNLLNKYLGRKKVIFNYFPRPFTVAAYKQSDLFLFPSNIECSPIVLFECAAAKLPFLATNVGNSAEIAQWTKGGEIMPTEIGSDGFSHANIKDSVKALNNFYKHRVEWKKKMEISHQVWKDKFSWEKITLEYEKLYFQLTGKK